jgi:CheY-like chemotaxis protein
MSALLRLLLVEDAEEDAEFIVRELRRAGYDAMSTRVDTAQALTEALAAVPWDLTPAR